jgi:protein gp37
VSKKPGDWWDESLNPIEGCEPISEACQNCWALSMMRRFRGEGLPRFRTYPRRLDILGTWKKPRRIFVGSLTDMLHEQAWPYLMAIIRKAHQYPRHTFVVLTKRPHMIEDFKVGSRYHASPYSFYMDNVWFGVTTESQLRFDERISELEKHPFKVRFISAEPLLGPINLGSAAKWLNWVIVGGETGPGARPMHPDWVKNIRDQCQAAGIKFWFKGWGAWFFEGRPVNPNDPAVRIINAAGGYGFHGENAIHVRRQRNTGRFIDGREWSELPGGTPLRG